MKLEDKKLASGLTYGQWADEQLRLGNYDCTREDLIAYCDREMRRYEKLKQTRIPTIQERLESMEGGMGAL